MEEVRHPALLPARCRILRALAAARRALGACPSSAQYLNQLTLWLVCTIHDMSSRIVKVPPGIEEKTRNIRFADAVESFLM
jgi:hypothetical protein